MIEEQNILGRPRKYDFLPKNDQYAKIRNFLYNKQHYQKKNKDVIKCEACNKDIKKVSFQTHVKSKTHIRNENYMNNNNTTDNESLTDELSCIEINNNKKNCDNCKEIFNYFTKQKNNEKNEVLLSIIKKLL